MVYKSYILTGYDMTSKVGTKSAALKASPERFLHNFGEYDVTDTIFHNAEKYLVNVIRLKTTSLSIRGHFLRSHYVVSLCLNLLDPKKHTLQPLNYGWYGRNGMLLPEKFQCLLPEKYTITCACCNGCYK